MSNTVHTILARLVQANWFDDMSPEAQSRYIQKNPNSKYAKQSRSKKDAEKPMRRSAPTTGADDSAPVSTKKELRSIDRDFKDYSKKVPKDVAQRRVIQLIHQLDPDSVPELQNKIESALEATGKLRKTLNVDTTGYGGKASERMADAHGDLLKYIISVGKKSGVPISSTIAHNMVNRMVGS